MPSTFTILCLLVWKLSCWQTNKHKQTHIHKKTHKPTNKQTDAAENIYNVLRYATTLGKEAD